MPSSPPGNAEPEDAEPGDAAPEEGTTEAGEQWLDLFYDLVFVAAILILSSRFSHPPDDGEAIWFAGAFVSVWWIWLAMTMHANRFPVDDLVYRVLTLFQMFLVALVAIAASDGLHVHPEFVSVAYALLTLTVAITYERSARRPGEKAAFARSRAIEYTVAAAVFVVAGFVPDPLRVVLWAVGLAVTIAPAVAHCTTAPPLAEKHLIARLGALTIIMCGEAFVKVALAADNSSFDDIDVVTAGLEFVLVFTVWANYFDDVPHAGAAPEARPRSLWLFAHLLLHVGIIGMAVGVARFVTFHPGQDIPTDDVAGVAVPMALVYVAMILIASVSRRRPIGPLVRMRIAGIAAVAAIVVLAEVAPWFDTYWSVSAFAVVGIAEAALEAVVRRRTEIVPVPAPT
jgi:low temperature requirement protein LtrA